MFQRQYIFAEKFFEEKKISTKKQILEQKCFVQKNMQLKKFISTIQHFRRKTNFSDHFRTEKNVSRK